MAQDTETVRFHKISAPGNYVKFGFLCSGTFLHLEMKMLDYGGSRTSASTL